MRNIFKFRVAGILIMLVMTVVFGAVVMLLWNALLPGLFSLPALNYWQATGILLLVRILAGGLGHGFARHGGERDGAFFHGHSRGHVNKLREKWMNMSEEERREFIKKERGFAGFQDRFSGFNRFFDDDQGKKEKENE